MFDLLRFSRVCFRSISGFSALFCFITFVVAENGRGVFLFVVMGCVVWFGVCVFVVMVDCDYLLYIVVVCFGDICWCSLLSSFCFVWVGSNVFCSCGSIVPRSQPRAGSPVVR
jgi:hypothetical protein